jgi:hypothetical protein
MKDSIVKDFVRGPRRYFPLTETELEWERYREAFYIAIGREPEDNIEVGLAIVNLGLGEYIEEFDGRFWVRTIAEV